MSLSALLPWRPLNYWTTGKKKVRSDLKADDVCVTVGDVLHDAFFPVLPVEGPGRAVSVQLPCGVLVTQHVIAHDCEGGCKHEQTCEETLVNVLITTFLFFPTQQPPNQ